MAAAVDNFVYLINPGVGDRLVQAKTDEILKEIPAATGDLSKIIYKLKNQSMMLIYVFLVPQKVRTVLSWDQPDKEQWTNGFRVILTHSKPVKQVAWHGKGDYFSSVMPDGANRSVLIHQLSRRRSQLPFTKSKGLIQSCLFHPLRPYFIVAVRSLFTYYNSTLNTKLNQLIRHNVTCEFTIFLNKNLPKNCLLERNGCRLLRFIQVIALLFL